MPVVMLDARMRLSIELALTADKGDGRHRLRQDAEAKSLGMSGAGWAMEVVNQQGTSTVWNELFETDDAAFGELRRTVDREGMKKFLDDSNVVPSKR